MTPGWRGTAGLPKSRGMQTLLTWAARLVLLAVLTIAAYGALDPHHNAERSVPPADVVEHVGYGFLLTVLSIAALPRLSPWLIGGAFLAAGAGLEISQAFGVISGTFQWKDLASNLAGVVAALGAFALGRRSR